MSKLWGSRHICPVEFRRWSTQTNFYWGLNHLQLGRQAEAERLLVRSVALWETVNNPKEYVETMLDFLQFLLADADDNTRRSWCERIDKALVALPNWPIRQHLQARFEELCACPGSA